jgi:ABC-type dipeptide/oligopeptide/nickel transport system permease subunit
VIASRRLRLGGDGWLGLRLGVGLLSLLVVLALLRSVVAPIDPFETNLIDRLSAPGNASHWLGTDYLGRDMWSRAVHGLAWSLSAALAATAIALAIGATLGLLAARRGGFARALVQWGVDTVIALPGIVIAICVIAVVGQGWAPMVATLGLLSWPVFARVVQAEARALLTQDFIAAAEQLGASESRLLFGHVLPGLRASLSVVTAFHFADMLIAESALSFLGIGTPLGTPTWGNMLADSRQYLLVAPWMMLVPAGAIVLAVVAANLIGDGLAARQRARERGQ